MTCINVREKVLSPIEWIVVLFIKEIHRVYMSILGEQINIILFVRKI